MTSRYSNPLGAQAALVEAMRRIRVLEEALVALDELSLRTLTYSNPRALAEGLTTIHESVRRALNPEEGHGRMSGYTEHVAKLHVAAKAFLDDTEAIDKEAVKDADGPTPDWLRLVAAWLDFGDRIAPILFDVLDLPEFFGPPAERTELQDDARRWADREHEAANLLRARLDEIAEIAENRCHESTDGWWNRVRAIATASENQLPQEGTE
jgi:hypothetical protein